MISPDPERTGEPFRDDEPYVHHADVGAAPAVRPASSRVMVIVAIAVVVIFAALFVARAIPRRATDRALASEAAATNGPPEVVVGRVIRGASGGTVELPGTIEALHEGAIYARVAGYVKSWKYDIGATVHAGDVLAELDAPELTQNVEQAKHELAQVKATLALTQADLSRWKEMAADSAVSRQELDQKQAAYDVASANAGASQANLQRLTEMENYTHVRAPFTGVVTARNVDIGSLITSAGATSAAVGGSDPAAAGSGGALFRIAETDTVRTFLTVPENYSTAMSTGLAADVSVQELPGHPFVGHVTRTSRSLDAGSRTLLTEIDIANPGSRLLPGMYATIQMKFPTTAPPLIMPATALLIRNVGPQVMVVDSTGTVHIQSVELGRDFGARIEVLGGVVEGAMVVTSPGPDLMDGMKVHITMPKADSATRPAPATATPPPVKPPK